MRKCSNTFRCVQITHRNRLSIDMYSTFGTKRYHHNVQIHTDVRLRRTVGTSRDVTFLIDFLPAYLYPSAEKTIKQWLVAGISLGGHSTWISLRTGMYDATMLPWMFSHGHAEPRVRLGIPIIGPVADPS